MAPHSFADRGVVTGNNEVSAWGVVVVEKPEYANWKTVHRFARDHERSDTNEFVAVHYEHNVESLPNAKRLPPAKNPVVTEEWMVYSRLVDQAVPLRTCSD